MKFFRRPGSSSHGGRTACWGEVSLSSASSSEVESFVAEVWVLLEKHSLASPKLVAKWQADRMRVTFVFASKRDSDVIASELRIQPASPALIG